MSRGCVRPAVSALVLLVALATAAHAVNPYLQARREERIRRLGPLVREIHFVGNDAFSGDRLLAYMAIRESGFFGVCHYNRRTLGRDLENLRSFYTVEGFLDAEVTLEDIRLEDDGLSVELLIGIIEGDRWHVSGITFDGERVVPEGDLLAATATREGGPYRIRQLESDRDRILDVYARRSYLDARVTQEVERDDVARLVEVRYRIVERERGLIGSIEIIGDDKTREFVIARELEFSEGEFFDSDKIGLSQANIYRTGLFSSVWIEPADADTGKAKKAAVVRVGEVPSGAVDIRIGYAVHDGLEVSGGVSNRNVQGQAIRLAAGATVAELTRGVEVSVRDPWFLGVPVAIGAKASYTWFDEDAFEAETTHGGAILTKSFGAALSIEGGYEFERTVVLDTSEDTDELGTNYTTDLVGAVTYDTRDDIMNSRRGMLARIEGETASSRLGGTNDFQRTELMWRGYVEILPRKIAALSARAGWIKPQGDGGDVPVNERYFAGGDGSVRGFERNSLGPAGAEGDAKGGRGVIELRAEARFPLYRSLRMVAFVDAGQAYEDFGAITRSGLAIGAGGGLRYGTRIGVIRFDVAAPVTRIGPTQFYFGVGQAF